MNVYDFAVKDRSGKDISLKAYEGKILLIINSATQCGFTPQYGPLEKLYDKYKDQGFVILDFPSNQFHNQAPESEEEIQNFCEMNYGVTFPGFSKIEVNGENSHPLYSYLKGQKGFDGFNMEHPIAPKLIEILSAETPDFKETADIKWNFTKFLIDKEGNVADRFEPTESFEVIEERIKDLIK